MTNKAYPWICNQSQHGDNCQCLDSFNRQHKDWQAKVKSDESPSSYDYPAQACPYCGASCECDTVDIGVGLAQCGPFNCLACQASEVGPEGRNGLPFFEQLTGWYEPGRPVSPLANTYQGALVDHKEAEALYSAGLLDEKRETS